MPWTALLRRGTGLAGQASGSRGRIEAVGEGQEVARVLVETRGAAGKRDGLAVVARPHAPRARLQRGARALPAAPDEGRRQRAAHDPTARLHPVEHALGNYRTLLHMASELLAAAAQREAPRIDEKLYLEVFTSPDTRKPTRHAPARTRQ